MAKIESHINPQPTQRKYVDKNGEERITTNTRSVATHPSNAAAGSQRGKIENLTPRRNLKK